MDNCCFALSGNPCKKYAASAERIDDKRVISVVQL